MRLWLVCCVLMFAAAQGYEWVGRQLWFADPDLSLPWLLLGGAGLAIASNLGAVQQLWPAPSTRAGASSAPSPTQSSPAFTNPAPGPDPAGGPTAKKPSPKGTGVGQTSISFEVPKNPHQPPMPSKNP